MVVLEYCRPDGRVRPIFEFPMTCRAGEGRFENSRAAMARAQAKISSVPWGTTYGLFCARCARRAVDGRLHLGRRRAVDRLQSHRARDREPSYDIGKTGAADAVREVGSEVKQAARKAQTEVMSAARQARKIPGVAQVEGQVKGAVASEEDLAIAETVGSEAWVHGVRPAMLATSRAMFRSSALERALAGSGRILTTFPAVRSPANARFVASS